MSEVIERPPTGAGFPLPTRLRPEVRDVINVLTQQYRTDLNGNEQSDWADKLINSDLLADMERQYAEMALDSILSDTRPHTKPLRDHVIFLIREELKL